MGDEDGVGGDWRRWKGPGYCGLSLKSKEGDGSMMGMVEIGIDRDGWPRFGRW